MIQDSYDAINEETEYKEDVQQAVDSIDEVNNMSIDGEHEIRVIAGTREFMKDINKVQTHSQVYNQTVAESKTSVKQMKKAIINQIKGTDPRWNVSQKSGRLNNKQVYKVLSGASDSRYVFKKKNTPAEPSGNAID